MAWIEFNGIRSTDYGVIIESMPDAARAARRTKVVEPYGRNGNITIDEGSFGVINGTININCFGKIYPNVIFGWLNGAGWLITSDDPSKRRWATFYGAQTAKRYRNGSVFDTVTVPVVMDTFCHTVQGISAILDRHMTVNGVGDYTADPILYIKGTGNGTVTINGNKIYITSMLAGHTLKVDAEARFYVLIKDSDGSTLNPLLNGVTVELEPDDDNSTRWFYLNNVGVNNIDIEGLSGTIDYNWRWY